MTDLYAQQYESAGPIARPVIQRSQYLADALRALQNTSENPIRSRSQLGVNLLAQALTQYQQNRNQSQLQNATEKDSASLNDALAASVRASLGLQPPDAAPAASAPAQPHISIDQLATALGASGPPTPIAQTPPTAAMGTGSGVGTGGPSNRDIKTRDAVIRLLALEDNHPQGQQAVGNVILNRARTGMDLADVITQPSQFEPYGNRQTWERGMQIPATDPRYQQAERAWEAAQQQDITGGALNFYGPETQRALGRPPPDFARQGGGERIGGNVFFPGQFAPPAGYQAPTLEELTRVRPQQAVPPPPPAPDAYTAGQNRTPNAAGVYYQTAPSGAGADGLSSAAPPPPAPPPQSPGPPAGGAPPAATSPAAPPPPAAGGQPPQSQFLGNGRVSRQQVESALAMMQSQDPRVAAMGRQELQRLAALGAGPVEQNVQITQMGQRITTNPYTGQGGVEDIAGYRVAPHFAQQNGGTIAIDPRTNAATPIQTPQSMLSRPMTPQDAAGLVPGTAGDINPNTGERHVLQTPPAGYMYQGGRAAPIPGSSADITAPAQRAPALIAQRDRLRPTLEQANMVFQNINAVRRGVEAQSGPGDLAIANGFQQLLNSGMVTGEEINAQARSLGLQGQVGSIIQYVLGGGNLTPEARAQFGRLAEQLYVPRLRQIQQQVMSQRDLLDQYGPGSFDLVVPPSLRQELGWEPRPHQRHGAAQGQPSARRPRLVGSF